MVSLANCGNLIYVSGHQPVAFYQCYKQSGLNQVILLLDSTYPNIDASDVQNIQNAKNAGLSVEVLLNPCRSRPAED